MEFLSVVNSLGTVPFLALLVVIFILLFREVKADTRGEVRQAFYEA